MIAFFLLLLPLVMGTVQKEHVSGQTWKQAQMKQAQMTGEVRGFTETWLEAMGEMGKTEMNMTEAFLEMISPQTVITITCDLPFCGKHLGFDGFMEAFVKMHKTIAVQSQRAEIVTVSETQYSAITKIYMAGQCRETNEALEMEMVSLVDFEITGEIKSIHCFPKNQEELRRACLPLAEKKWWALAEALFSVEVLHDEHPVMDLISPEAEFHIQVTPSSLLSRDKFQGHSGFLQLMAESQRTKWMMMKAKPLLAMMMKTSSTEIRVLHSNDDDVYVMMVKGDFVVYSHMVFGEKMLLSEEILLPRTIRPWDIHKYPKVPLQLWNLGGPSEGIGEEQIRLQDEL